MGQSYRELNRMDLENVLIKHLDTISAVTNTPFAVENVGSTITWDQRGKQSCIEMVVVKLLVLNSRC